MRSPDREDNPRVRRWQGILLGHVGSGGMLPRHFLGHTATEYPQSKPIVSGNNRRPKANNMLAKKIGQYQANP